MSEEKVQFEVGESASFSKTITDADVTLFAGVTGDLNPVHIDELAAKRTRFGGRVAHGMLGAGLISTVLGTRLPGPGTIYLSQTLKFTAPMRVGDTITATVTVKSARPDKPLYTLETVVTNQHGTTVIEGEAVVLHDL